MIHFRLATMSLLVILACGLRDLEAADPKPKMPHLVGDWLSDSPLDSFVRDDSVQPVNKFRIEKSKEADFQARYLGSKATGVSLEWNTKSQRFEGTMNERGTKATFVVTPTDDPDVLTCEIESDFLVTKDSNVHKDKWKRVRKELSAPAATKSDPIQQAVLRYEESSDLTPKMKHDSEVLLSEYSKYLKNIGFDLQKGRVVLRIQNGMRNAHYYHTNESIVIDPQFAIDESILCREYNHHALAVALGEDSAEVFQKCSGIESGLADYFGCSYSNDPIVGPNWNGDEGFLRTMDNRRQFTEIYDKSGRHFVGEVLCGALWEIRESVDYIVLDRLLLKAWRGLAKSDRSKGQVTQFVASLIDVADKESPKLARLIQAIFEDRGFEFAPNPE